MEVINEELKNYQPDVLTSDIILLDLDGYSLIKKVHAYEQERGKKIIAVAVTGAATDVDRDRAITQVFMHTSLSHLSQKH